MNKEELMYHLKENGFADDCVPDSHYKLIEKVYTYHPAISETTGKAQVAWLYANLGITVFLDMEATADKAAEIEKKMQHAREMLEQSQKEMSQLKCPIITPNNSKTPYEEYRSRGCNDGHVVGPLPNYEGLSYDGVQKAMVMDNID